MNSTFPGGGRSDEVLVGTSKRRVASVLEKVRSELLRYREIRFGEKVRGNDGKLKFPIFGKDE